MIMLLGVISSCTKYLDVVPDNVATIDNAFTISSQAKKFLFTCYSYMPRNGDLGADPAMVGGDEIWRINDYGGEMFNIARGFQKVVEPFGGWYWQRLFSGIRDCNIFLENIDRVPDLDETEKRRWIAEVKFLKAYYHFYLVRMYGPIPLAKVNMDIDAGPAAVQVPRSHVDTCFNYITQLIDESLVGLPTTITDPASELGRITNPIALAFKAYVLVTAASPLFNGNVDQQYLVNRDGTPLFDSEYDADKWRRAADACKTAIDVLLADGLKLYTYNPSFDQYNLTEEMKTQLSIRNSVTERWNSEIIWANTQTNSNGLQQLATPPLAPQFADNNLVRGELSPPLKIAELYYTSNGLPINEDKTWSYTNRFDIRNGTEEEKLFVKAGYSTAQLNFDREPRYYASLGFDGGIWYGHERYDDKGELFYLEARKGQRNSGGNNFRSTVTGFFIKKLIHFQNVIGPGLSQTYSATSYPWPIMRLADLYLLYAESLNEVDGPNEEAFKYIDLVRERAGLPTVEFAWANFSTNPSKIASKDGLRDIIQQERLIELAFEGHRFWDLRRWKTATDVMNSAIKGWDLQQTNPIAYYVPRVIINQTFGVKDYFWPIAERELTVNRNLVQNLGW